MIEKTRKKEKEDGTFFVGRRDSTRGLSKFTGVCFLMLATFDLTWQVAPRLPTCGEIELFWSSSILNLR